MLGAAGKEVWHVALGTPHDRVQVVPVGHSKHSQLDKARVIHHELNTLRPASYSTRLNSSEFPRGLFIYFYIYLFTAAYLISKSRTFIKKASFKACLPHYFPASQQ